MRLNPTICGTAAALLLAPPAAAHVTVNPDEAPADSFSRFAIRVPTERDAPTTRVSVRMPEGLFFVSFQPKPGWRREVKMERLDRPVEVSGDRITERVASVTWSGGRIGPGEFDEFGMSARMPERSGADLVFPAVQRYASGEVVRWIGPPDSEEPAPRVAVGPPEEEAEAQPAAAPASGDGDDDGGDSGIALAFGIAGLVVGLAALAVAVTTRRSRAAAR